MVAYGSFDIPGSIPGPYGDGDGLSRPAVPPGYHLGCVPGDGDGLSRPAVPPGYHAGCVPGDGDGLPRPPLQSASMSAPGYGSGLPWYAFQQVYVPDPHPVVPSRQSPPGRSTYNRPRPPVRSTRSYRAVRPRSTPPVNRYDPVRPPRSRVSKSAEQIEESRQKLDRSKQQRSILFAIWLVVSLISGLRAYKAASVVSLGNPHAPGLIWWLLGSGFSLVVAIGCFIGNLQQDHG
jgi:hypothetical protein